MPQSPGRVLLLSVSLSLAFASGGVAQNHAESLRAGNTAAVHAAAAAMHTPNEAEVNGLLALLNAGQAHASPAMQAGELAYAVLGWWSMIDAGIANGLLDRFEQRDWPKLQQPLLELATLGATDGAARAVRWLASDDVRVRHDALLLLRRVGGNRATITRAIEQGMESWSADSSAVLGLIWEFQHASEALRKQLQERADAAASWAEKLPILWAMVRGGAFRTEWLLAQWRDATGEQRRAISYAVGQCTDAVALRLVNELRGIEDEESRAVILKWLRHKSGPPLVRNALQVLSNELQGVSRRRVDVILANSAPRAPELLAHWLKRLSDEDPKVQRVACQALIRYGDHASAAVDPLIALLQQAQPKGARLHGAAMLALASIGEAAGSAGEVLKTFRDSDDLDLADIASWSLLRVWGQVGGIQTLRGLQQRSEKLWPWSPTPRLPAEDAVLFARKMALHPSAASQCIDKMLACRALGASAVPAALLAIRYRQDAHRGWVCLAASKLPEVAAPLVVPRVLTGWICERPSLGKPADMVSLSDVHDVFTNITVFDTDRHVRARTGSLQTWVDDLWKEWLPVYGSHEHGAAPMPLLQWIAPRRPKVFQVSIDRLVTWVKGK